MAETSPPVALITGAGSGIGRATAIELASHGYRLVLVGRRRESLEQTAELIELAESMIHPADVSEPAACQASVEAAVAAYDRIDLLVNNAGVAPVLPIEQTSVRQWRAVIDTNLSAAFFLIQAAWPVFQRQNAGVVVNLSSLAARDPFPNFCAYAAAKAGLNGLSLAVAREGAASNIRVHTLGLGAVETELLRSVVTEAQWPAEKTLSPQAVAKVIAQCATGDLQASSGEVIWLHRTPA